jgi:UDP-2-acetamido-3-amino-2,3-dideoxy-glucuronate N-acetyltransferase
MVCAWCEFWKRLRINCGRSNDRFFAVRRDPGGAELIRGSFTGQCFSVDVGAVMSAVEEHQVHESSYVDDDVEIGNGTQIWHFCHVLPGSRIGERCRIGQNVVIGPNAIIGNNVSVYQGVILEDDVFCGPSIVFTNIATPRSAFPRNNAEDNLATLVKRGASIGANATIVCGNTIGECALIGAGAVVTKDVKSYALVYGNPAKQHGWACACGVPLSFTDNSAQCTECGRVYIDNNGNLEPQDAADSQDAA